MQLATMKKINLKYLTLFHDPEPKVTTIGAKPAKVLEISLTAEGSRKLQAMVLSWIPGNSSQPREFKLKVGEVMAMAQLSEDANDEAKELLGGFLDNLDKSMLSKVVENLWFEGVCEVARI